MVFVKSGTRMNEITPEDVGIMMTKITLFLSSHTENLKVMKITDLESENLNGCSNYDSLLFYDEKSSTSIPPNEILHINDEIFILTFGGQFKKSNEENKLVDFKFIQKWYSSETYEYVKNGKIDKAYTGLGIRHCNIVIYEKVGFNKELNRFVQEQLLRRQTFAKCRKHGRYLSKIHNRTNVICQMPNCKRRSCWRCPHTLVGNYCTTSLCSNHMQENINNGNVMELAFVEREIDESPVNDSECEEEYEEIAEAFNVQDNENNDVDEIVGYINDVIDGTLYCGLNENAAKDQIDEPIYVHKGASEHGFSESINGAYILNSFGRIRSKLRSREKMPTLLQSFLQKLYDSHSSICVSLMDFEALIFPQIFPFVENESAIGALPISMFMHPLVKRNERLASLMNHLYVRTMDQTILTAMEPQYMHFVFNIMINSLVSGNFIFHAIRKGVEFLKRPREGIQTYLTEASMLYDTVEQRAPAVELGALANEYKFDIFFTYTCNQKLTPGVSKLCNNLEDYITSVVCAPDNGLSTSEAEKLKIRIYNSHITSITRNWDRTVRWYERYIVNGEDTPFGRIKAYWSR